MADRSPGDRLAVLVWAEVKASGARQVEVAADAGISEKHLSQMFNGKVRMSVGMADRLLGAVGRRLVIGTKLVTEEADHG